MTLALAQAKLAADCDEVPVGAVVVLEGKVIGMGFNQPISSSDPTAHAEICALRAAAQEMNNYRLPGADLYVTVEPCTMCAGALVHARIRRLIYGANEPRAGAVRSQARVLENPGLNHQVEVVADVLGDVCSNIIKEYFREKRR